MDKSRTLLLPIGQGASIIANGLKRKNQRYPILFINSTPKDSVGLEFFKPNMNVVLYNGAKGTGNNRKLGKELAIENRFAIASKLASYNSIDTFVVLFTMAGGTGNGGFSTVVKLIKKAYPNKKINLVAIAPRIDEGIDRLSNAIQCWNEMNDLFKYVNDIKVVDNGYKYNKEISKSFDVVNNAVIEHLDAMFSLSSGYNGSSMDENDALKVCTAQGFGKVLLLPSECENVNKAIDIALNNNPFIFPEDSRLKCKYAGINIIEGIYNEKDIYKEIESSTEPYLTHNNKQNIIVLGGGDTPTEFIDIIDISLNEAKIEEFKRERNAFKTHKITLDDVELDDLSLSKDENESELFMDDEDDDLLFDDSWL